MEEVGTENTSPIPAIQRTSTSINTKKKRKPVKRFINSLIKTRKKIRCVSPSSSKYSLSDVTIIQRTHGLVKDEQAIQNSLNVSTSLGPNFDCSYCGIKFYSGMKLKIHLLMEHMVENCMICDLLFVNAEQRVEHESKVHSANICEICHGSFDEIAEHYKKGHDAVICNYCNILLHPSEHYFKHVIEHHCAKEEFVKTEDLEDIGESRRAASAFFCKLCEKTRHRELFGHYSYYHKINIYYLAKVFKKIGLDLKLSNLEVEDKPKIKSTDSCKVCSSVYTKQAPKCFHKVFCEGYTSCPHCPKVFEIPETLDKHLTEVHKTQNSTETCPLCEENDTEEHLLSHNAPQLKPYLLESDFSCSLCSLTLPSSNTKEIFTHFKNEHSVSTIKILNLIGPRPPSQSSDSDSESESHSKNEEEYRIEFNPKYVRLYFDPITFSIEEKTIPCEFCLMDFPNKLKLLGHYYEKHNFKFPESFSECSLCTVEAKNFCIETHLEHFLEGQSSKTFECIKCYFKIGGDEARKHILEVHGDSLVAFNKEEWGLRCRFCEESFWEEEEANRHELDEHLEEGTKKDFLECFRCEKTFTNLKSLQKHNPPPTSCLEENPDCKSFSEFAYQCTICNRAFPSQAHLRDHFVTMHPKLAIVFCADENCKRTFSQKKYAKLHFKNMHEGRTVEPSSYECETCGRSFTSRKGYLLHRKNSQKGFKCVICGEKFQMPEFRKHHYQTVHPGELVYECNECQKTFRNKSGLHIHTRQHTEFSSVCSYCGKEFFRRDSYKEHLLIHIGPKHRCPYCPKFFTQKSNLHRHIRLHTGEKPYSCPHCPKKFSDKGACNSHVSVHTRQAECFCEICGKKFSKQQKLRYHMKRHTGEGLLICSICHRGFTSQYDLKKHVTTHDQQTQIICQCGRGFSSEKYLRTHIKLVHDPKKQNSNNIVALYNNRVGKFNCFQCLLCKNYYSARTTISRHLKKIHKIERKEYSKHIRHLDPEEESNFTRTVFEENKEENNEEEGNKDESKEENEESEENEEAFLYTRQLELQTNPIEVIKTAILEGTKLEEEINSKPEVNEEGSSQEVKKTRNRKVKNPSKYCGAETGSC